MGIKAEVNKRLAEIKKLSSMATELEATDICDTPIQYFDDWSDYIDGELKEGRIVSHQDYKVRVMQDIPVVLESQSPDMEGLLALYMKYRDSGEYPWIYGEYVELGWIRTETEVVDDVEVTRRYENTKQLVANIYTPSADPTSWTLVVDDELEI